MNVKKQFMEGMVTQNPVLVQLLGMCSVMAITTSLFNGIGMGISVLVILTCSNVVISLLRKFIPNQIRIACYIVVIASFVTIVDLCLQAFLPDLAESLGVFIPLIVVNCIILGRAEAFASKNSPLRSVLDGIGMGLGFTVALTLLGIIREFLCSGSVFGIKMIPAWETDFLLPGAAPGAFIIVGVILAIKNFFNRRSAIKAGRLYVPPRGLDCRNCHICSLPERD